jgi:NAD(P) transhydrogenase
LADSHEFDLVVIGGGPAGTCGAATAAVFGRNVALIERQRDVGGAGINTGTVPSKTLRETALALSGWRSRKLFGVDLSLRRQATVAELTHHMDDVICGEHRRMDVHLARSNVKRFQGVARFVDPHSVQVMRPDGSQVVLRGKTILIATGSSPVQPPEFPFTDDRVHDSDELLGIKTMPRTLIVVGAGVIGSEYACTFAALGVRVTVVDGRDALLPFLDLEMSAALLTAMTQDGITFLWNQNVVRTELSGSSGPVTLHLSGGQSISAEAVLVCAGRKSNTEELDLASAGITPGKRGLIEVDEHYCTSAPHIYAAGDVIGAPALAPAVMPASRTWLRYFRPACTQFRRSARRARPKRR